MEFSCNVLIEFTNACNFSCIMCPNKLMKRKKGFIDFELFRLILDRCEEAKIPKISLFTVGESLLHSRFLEMLWFAAHRSAIKHIGITTNGSMLDEKYMRELIKCEKCRVSISFSGWDKESYEKKYIGGTFEEIVNKIKLFNQIVLETKSSLRKLQVYGNVDQWVAAEKTVNFLVNSIGLKREQISIEHTFNWIDFITGEHGDDTNKQNYKKKATPMACFWFNKHIGVLYDGKVTACGCLDVDGDLVIGDIRKQTIREIRNGVGVKRLKRLFKQGDLRGLICYECDHKRKTLLK